MAAPVASFTASPESGIAPLTVAFTDTSTNTPTSWLWEARGGSDLDYNEFATDQNPSFDFGEGTYSIKLTATNADGSDAAEDVDFIEAMPGAIPPPIVYVEDPDDDFDYETDWKESIDNTQPGGGDHSSREQQECVLVGLIPFNKVVSAERYFLGYSYSDIGSPYALHRELPARHPRKPQLYAYTFSSIGISPKANFDNPNNSPYQLSPFENTNGDDLYYADYEMAICTVRYKSYGRMLFLADDDAELDGTYSTEWKRYTLFVGAPGIEALTADGVSQLAYAEGPSPGPDAAHPAGPFGTPFPVPVAQLMAKVKFSVEWFDVPHNYLSSNRYFLNPANIISRLGTTNLDEMFDGEFAVGTMLLVAAEFDSTLFPVIPNDPDNPVTGWKVKLHFDQFDPENRYSDDHRGHLIYPWRIDGKWYYATRSTAGETLLPQTDLMRVFQHVDDPG